MRRRVVADRIKREILAKESERRKKPKAWPDGFDVSQLRPVEKRMNPEFYEWSKHRRVIGAVDKVVLYGWQVTEAASEYGVTRSHVSRLVKERRLELEAQVAAGDLQDDNKRAFVPEKLTREMPPFEEWEKKYFGHVECPECERRHDLPEFHKEIISYCEDPTIKRLMINIPPNHAKSTLVTIKWVVYNICRDPNIKILIISESSDMSKAFLSSIKELLSNQEFYGDGPSLITDYGPFYSQQMTWSDTMIRVANRRTMEKDPTVQAIGLGSQIRSRRPNIVICDDCFSFNNQSGPDQVKKWFNWLSREVSNRAKGDPNVMSGKMVIIGNRANHEDTYKLLADLPAYRVVKYPCVIDDRLETVLWPDHFSYYNANLSRSEMAPGDFELIFQQNDLPGLGAAFEVEIVERAKDSNRLLGHFDPSWQIVAGLDLAGGGRDSGFTCAVVLAVDPSNGRRYLVDMINKKQMRAPEIKEMIFALSDLYPIQQWRVEVNGLQGQIVQYNEEIIQELARRGIRVVPHTTTVRKWDPTFGVEAMAVNFHAGMVSIPWGSKLSAQNFQPLVEQLIGFPNLELTDTVMAFWFADLAIRDLLKRAPTQHLSAANYKKMPSWVRQRMLTIDPHTGTVDRFDPTSAQATTPPALMKSRRAVDGRFPPGHVKEALPLNVGRLD